VRSWRIAFPAPGEVAVEEEEVPEAPGPGEVLVRARASLISTGTECIALTRAFEPGTHWDRWVRFPFRPGYSLVGEVVAAGPGVDGVRPGDRLAVRAPHAAHVVARRWVARVPEEIPDADAVYFALAAIVQHAVRRGAVTLGDRVVVVGCGLLGQLACQYARVAGARAVVAVDPARPRVEAALRLGATHGVAEAADRAGEAVRSCTDGEMADVVFEATGHPQALPGALGLARTLGRVVLVGDTGTPSAQHLTGDVVARGVSLIGAHDGHPPAAPTPWYPWTHARMVELFFELLRQGRMGVRALTTDVVSPWEAPAVYRELLQRREAHLGVVFDWTRLGR
jgi:2-desacetyl-2-hydroxyethyl bacteriochlorophyllide A dehydrogenase